MPTVAKKSKNLTITAIKLDNKPGFVRFRIMKGSETDSSIRMKASKAVEFLNKGLSVATAALKDELADAAYDNE